MMPAVLGPEVHGLQPSPLKLDGSGGRFSSISACSLVSFEQRRWEFELPDATLPIAPRIMNAATIPTTIAIISISSPPEFPTAAEFPRGFLFVHTGLRARTRIANTQVGLCWPAELCARASLFRSPRSKRLR